MLVGACAPARGQAAPPRTVEVTLVAGQTGANGTFNFNGYSRGALAVTVPVGWKVLIHYTNNSPLRHSFDVIRYTGTQPDSGPPPAFKGATTRDPVDGLGTGHTEAIAFFVGKTGKYEFLCGVLGHAQSGMWDYLLVSPTAKAPSVRPSGGVAFRIK